MFYNFKAKKMNTKEVKMEEHKGKVVLVVNTASKCGLTPKFRELEELYKEYKNRGFEILGFPCNQFGNQDPGSNEEVNEFCKYLTSEAKGLFNKKIKWNFTKFLVDGDGRVIKRYAPTVVPSKIKNDIEKLIENNN